MGAAAREWARACSRAGRAQGSGQAWRAEDRGGVTPARSRARLRKPDGHDGTWRPRPPVGPTGRAPASAAPTAARAADGARPGLRAPRRPRHAVRARGPASIRSSTAESRSSSSRPISCCANGSLGNSTSAGPRQHASASRSRAARSCGSDRLASATSCSNRSRSRWPRLDVDDVAAWHGARRPPLRAPCGSRGSGSGARRARTAARRRPRAGRSTRPARRARSRGAGGRRAGRAASAPESESRRRCGEPPAGPGRGTRAQSR